MSRRSDRIPTTTLAPEKRRGDAAGAGNGLSVSAVEIATTTRAAALNAMVDPLIPRTRRSASSATRRRRLIRLIQLCQVHADKQRTVRA